MLSPPTHLHFHPHRFKRHLWMIRRIILPVDGWMEGPGRTFRIRGTKVITFGRQICSVAVVICTKGWCGLILLPSLDFFVFIFVSLCCMYRTALLTVGAPWLFLNEVQQYYVKEKGKHNLDFICHNTMFAIKLFLTKKVFKISLDEFCLVSPFNLQAVMAL